MRILFLACTLCIAASVTHADNAAEEQKIGRMVLEIQEALKHPEKEGSLESIAQYGTLTPHYVMIRGWLGLELRGVESQLQAARDSELKAKHKVRADFLRKAIRRIDLE
jgi:hypothetical protein